jgi:hypothetical protein
MEASPSYDVKEPLGMLAFITRHHSIGYGSTVQKWCDCASVTFVAGVTIAGCRGVAAAAAAAHDLDLHSRQWQSNKPWPPLTLRHTADTHGDTAA